ncbi:protein phosphatase 2C family protein [Striga asiatica]|uniref:Protein phosphatase 2C family protein n=1 Tax=Striga asiatica TaxID=4170 RepID=A0A5A7NZZ0_STRAF|nr:protein phosphatase 2C family protein [Striga asiatica]
MLRLNMTVAPTAGERNQTGSRSRDVGDRSDSDEDANLLPVVRGIGGEALMDLLDTFITSVLMALVLSQVMTMAIFGNVPRVDGQLAMTRAFGDEKVMKHITVEPDVTIEKIDEDIEYVILASDGLWKVKVMSSEEAVGCIQGLKDEQESAEKLIEEALSRESKDYISCVVVMFH